MGSGVGKRKNAYKVESKPVTERTSVALQEEIVQFLAKVPLFKRLARKQLLLIAAVCTPCEFEASEKVIKQGDVGDDFFMIRSGSASVHVESETGPARQVTTLQAGDYFGERALLHDVPRTASVIAASHLSALCIKREAFLTLGVHKELPIDRRKAIAAGPPTLAKAPSPKTPEEREMIAQALFRNTHLQNMTTLDTARVQAMIDFCWLEFVPAAQKLIVEGDPVADYFYVVNDGCFDVSQVEKNGHDPRSAERAVSRCKSLRALGAGGSFGELALICAAPRSATVQAMADSSVWVFDRDNFKRILMSASAEKIAEYATYLDKIELLSPLLPSERQIVAEALIEVQFAADEFIMQQGEPGNSLHVLIDGEVAVLQDGAELKRLQCDESTNSHPFFGERALLNDEPRSASVLAVSAIVKTLVLDRLSFDLLLGPLHDIIKSHQAGGCDEHPSCRSDTQTLLKRAFSSKSSPDNSQHIGAETKQILQKDLKRIGLLGCGSFGFVEMHEHKVTGATYALKAQGKGYITKVCAQSCVRNERDILKMMDSVFIIRLYETYNGPDMIYFLMELALGGDLCTVYYRKSFWGSEKHARFYVAGVICAFEALHAHKIMYRDLKPENIMLTDAGHVKLTDMGLAKLVVGKTYTMCGTTMYFAPELLESMGYTHAVDWWTLGVIMFEFMSGYTPFEAGSDMETYAKIRQGIGKVALPKKWRQVVRDFVKALLSSTPCDRLPMRAGGTKNLRDHNWYAGFDWAAYCAQAVPAPYLPEVKSRKDLSNFLAQEDEKPEMFPYVDDGSGWDQVF